MKFNLRILALFLLAACSSAVRAERADLESLGMVPAQLTADELTDRVEFDLVLQPYGFEARKRQGAEGTMGLMEINASYDRVVTWLKKLGFTVLRTDPSCALIKLAGTREQLASGLQITFVREAASAGSMLVPVTGRSLPYRPAGSLLSVENLLMDLSGASMDSPDDQHLVKEWHPIHERTAGS